jgi:hypothetical protein
VISGTFVKVTGVSKRIESGSKHTAAFLFPEGVISPDNEIPPLTSIKPHWDQENHFVHQ